MVTKSIVGRFLVLAVLLASFGVIGQAAYKIAQQPARTVVARVEPAAPRADLAPPAPAKRDITPAVFVPAAAAAPAPADAAPVRVVYPGPLGDAPAQPRRPLESAAAAPAAPAPAPQAAAVQAVATVPAAPAPVAPAAKPVEVASADPAVGLPAAPAAAPAPAAGKGVNLNTASVDALNRLGGGHIGQAIVAHRPYGSVEDLVKKRVVRRSVYDQIRNQIAAD